MADPSHPKRRLQTAVAVCLAAFFTGTALFALPPRIGGAEQEKAPKGGTKIERYPPSFRLAVKAAIDLGAERIYRLQRIDGTWGTPKHLEEMGHTALPLLTLVKAGVDPKKTYIAQAYGALRRMEPRRVYSVGLYLMAIQARYQPKLDSLDTDVGTTRSKRLQPNKTWKSMSEQDQAELLEGVDFLLRSQNASGLWHYALPASGKGRKHDLSCSQYALLGLRAAMDCGAKIKGAVWRSALQGLLRLQDERGAKIELLDRNIRDGYAFESRVSARARGFHYSPGRKNGPLGEKTVFVKPATGSMTTAGVACLQIISEGLWRSRKFKGKDRKQVRECVRDGLAWMQTHFSVEKNPAVPVREANPHHYYYLYGLERMGMLAGRRWLGTHDWYKEGADLLLAAQRDDGGWGDHVQSSYAVLFLKRATRPSETVVTTD